MPSSQFCELGIIVSQRRFTHANVQVEKHSCSLPLSEVWAEGIDSIISAIKAQAGVKSATDFSERSHFVLATSCDIDTSQTPSQLDYIAIGRIDIKTTQEFIEQGNVGKIVPYRNQPKLKSYHVHLIQMIGKEIVDIDRETTRGAKSPTLEADPLDSYVELAELNDTHLTPRLLTDSIDLSKADDTPVTRTEQVYIYILLFLIQALLTRLSRRIHLSVWILILLVTLESTNAQLLI